MGKRLMAAIGPAGDHVRRQVGILRRDRGLSLEQLSARMGEVGRPILMSGLSKLENGERRVDVDDLVALAEALDVTPGAILPPADPDVTEKRLLAIEERLAHLESVVTPPPPRRAAAP